MTPYETLGVDRNCSQEDIKRSYRKLSMKFHPDKNPGDETATAKFQEITQAYSQIENPEKRREYDSTSAGMPPGMNVNMTEADFMQFMQHTMQSMHGQNIFQNFTHQQAQSPLFKALQKPQPIIKKLSITMELAFQGGSIPLTIERWQAINGEKTNETENIYIDIPRGIDNNEMLVIREKGNVIDNTKGDIKIFVNIENNTQFRRDGLDLIYDKEITLKDALCGFTFDIKYINGKTLKMNNKEGSIITPKFKKMVEKLGFKRGEHTGNLIVIFDVKFPSKLSSEQIQSIKEIL